MPTCPSRRREPGQRRVHFFQTVRWIFFGLRDVVGVDLVVAGLGAALRGAAGGGIDFHGRA
jgi:hypothetical protein